MELSIEQEVIQKLQTVITTDNPAIQSVMKFSFYNPRIISRSSLLLLCAEISATPREQAVNQAVAVELLDLAFLVHSGSFEMTATNPGCTTVRALLGEKIAILAGDYFFAQMFHILSAYPSVLMHYAEAMEYLIITSSTTGKLPKGNEAFLLSTCCKIGAAGGKPADSVAGLAQYGSYLGIAYHLFEEMADNSLHQAAVSETKELAFDYIDKSLLSLSSLASSPAKLKLIRLTLNLKNHIDEFGEAGLHAPAID